MLGASIAAVTPAAISIRADEAPPASITGVNREQATELLEATLPILARTSMALLGDARASKQILETLAERAGTELGKASDADDGRLALFSALRKLCAEHQTLTGPLRRDEAPETARMGKAADARQRLERLRPTERDALVLKLVARLDVDEIAKVCGIDEATARDRLTKALAATSGEGER